MRPAMCRQRVLLALLVLLLALAAAPAQAPCGGHPDGRVVVAQFEGGLPAGWEWQVREGTPHYRIEGGALDLTSNRDSFGLKREIKVDLAKFPYLNWRWKAEVLPKGGDGRHAKTDDQAAQVYVVFPRWPYMLRSQMICYTWENLAPKGSSFPSPARGLTHYVVLRDRSDRLKVWVSEKRNVYEDYKRLFGGTPPGVGGITLYINSQHTGSSAESAFADVYFSRN